MKVIIFCSCLLYRPVKSLPGPDALVKILESILFRIQWSGGKTLAKAFCNLGVKRVSEISDLLACSVLWYLYYMYINISCNILHLMSSHHLLLFVSPHFWVLKKLVFSSLSRKTTKHPPLLLPSTSGSI